MKHICFLTDSIFSFGGVQRVTAVIAKELAKDHRVTVVTFDSPQAEDPSMYGLGEADIRYRFFRYPQARRAELLFCKAYSYLYRKVLPQNRLTSWLYGLSSFTSVPRKALADELNRGGYDIIIGVHGPLSVRLATVRKRLKAAKVYGWIHNSHEAMFSEGSMYAGPELERHYTFQYMRLDRVVVLCGCDKVKYDVRAQAGMTVIHNPLTLTPGRRADGKNKRFLAVGRMSARHKGFDILIEAFSIFAAGNSGWTLDIIGEGPEEEALRELIRRHGLDGRIRIHPFTKDIQEFYSNAAIYVLSSRWEGFGLVMVEAMAHGLPVISSDIPSSIEVLKDTGMYFKNGDCRDLAARLDEATRIDWAAKSAEALATAERFRLETIAGEWRKLMG